MVRQAHHDTIVTLSLRRELSRTLVEGLDCPVKPDNDKLVMTYIAVYSSGFSHYKEHVSFTAAV